MKHKAQDSLDEICLNWGYADVEDFQKKEGEYYSKDFIYIKQLIDCQLTEEEIYLVARRINFLIEACMFSPTQERCQQIKQKLQKQKEMWCEDEC